MESVKLKHPPVMNVARNIVKTNNCCSASVNGLQKMFLGNTSLVPLQFYNPCSPLPRSLCSSSPSNSLTTLMAPSLSTSPHFLPSQKTPATPFADPSPKFGNPLWKVTLLRSFSCSCGLGLSFQLLPVCCGRVTVPGQVVTRHFLWWSRFL